MTPKEKAFQLVESMAFSCRECDYESKAKKCALIAVNEMIDIRNGLYYNDGSLAFQYLDQVKKEIEAL